MSNVMVCVTQQKNCDRLIRYGKEMMAEEQGELSIIHIAKYEVAFLGKSKEGDALEYLYQKALEYGANLNVVRSEDILATLIELVEKNKVNKVIMGESKAEDNTNNIADQFAKSMNGKVELIILPSSK